MTAVIGTIHVFYLKNYIGRNLSKNWSTGELEKELEGECLMMKVLKARVAKFSGNL